jgi:hypothetical protein
MQGSGSPYCGRGMRNTDLSFTALNRAFGPDDLVAFICLWRSGASPSEGLRSHLTAWWLDQSEQRRSSSEEICE